jgi:hypothetical protein
MSGLYETNGRMLYGASQGDEFFCYTYFQRLVDFIANFGLALSDIDYWNKVPLFIIDSFVKNQLSLSSFHVCTS